MQFIAFATVAGCGVKDEVKTAQAKGDLQNLECIIQKDGKQFAKYLDIRNDTWVASKLYDTNLFQYSGKPKTGEVELESSAAKGRQYLESGLIAAWPELLKSAGQPESNKIEIKVWNHNMTASYEELKNNLKNSDRLNFCFDVVIGREGIPVCKMGLSPSSMNFFILERNMLPNGRLDISDSESLAPDYPNPARTKNDLSGVCRKQEEVILR